MLVMVVVAAPQLCGSGDEASLLVLWDTGDDGFSVDVGNGGNGGTDAVR